MITNINETTGARGEANKDEVMVMHRSSVIGLASDGPGPPGLGREDDTQSISRPDAWATQLTW